MDEGDDRSIRSSCDARTQLIEKLGERLIYERAFLRLYKAYLNKHLDSGSAFEGSAPYGQRELDAFVSHKCRQLDHLINAIQAMGGRPESPSPNTDLSTLVRRGIVSVFTDESFRLLALVNAIRVIELRGRAKALDLVQLAHAWRKPQLADELSALQDESRLKILNLNALCRSRETRSRARRHLRALRFNLSPLH
jgi:hypothetical protein